MNDSSNNKFNLFAKNPPETVAICISNIIKSELYFHLQHNSEGSTLSDGHYVGDVHWIQLYRLLFNHNCEEQEYYIKYLPTIRRVFGTDQEHSLYNVVIYCNGDSGIIMNDIYQICGMEILILSTTALSKDYQII